MFFLGWPKSMNSSSFFWLNPFFLGLLNQKNTLTLINCFIFLISKYSDRTWPMIIVGTILFLPGFYHVRLAYYAWQEYEGFSFEDIPNDDD